MNERDTHHVPILLWPFALLWRLLGFVLHVTSRIVAALLGLVLMVAGVVLTMSVLGAPAGIALCAFGFLLLVRALF
ncbi:MAG TPA: hypothetical protein VFE85_00055 [Woeseiaceae bacterium]|nr:hypothetical protein [Woeseiaceae bacterium]